MIRLHKTYFVRQKITHLRLFLKKTFDLNFHNTYCYFAVGFAK